MRINAIGSKFKEFAAPIKENNQLAERNIATMKIEEVRIACNSVSNYGGASPAIDGKALGGLQQPLA